MKSYEGKLKSGKITKDFKKEVILNDISGKWEYKLEEDHYKGKFKNKDGEREIDIIGKWGTGWNSTDFYGLLGDKRKKNNAKELKSMGEMEDNVDYRLVDFIKHNGYKSKGIFDEDWEIIKVNMKYTSEEKEKLIEMIKKDNPKDKNTNEEVMKEVEEACVFVCLIYKVIGINYDIEIIKKLILNIEDENSILSKIKKRGIKFNMFNIEFAIDKDIVITSSEPLFYNDDELLKKKSILLYDGKYIIYHYNDIVKYELIKNNIVK